MGREYEGFLNGACLTCQKYDWWLGNIKQHCWLFDDEAEAV